MRMHLENATNKPRPQRVAEIAARAPAGLAPASRQRSMPWEPNAAAFGSHGIDRCRLAGASPAGALAAISATRCGLGLFVAFSKCILIGAHASARPSIRLMV